MQSRPYLYFTYATQTAQYIEVQFNQQVEVIQEKWVSCNTL